MDYEFLYKALKKEKVNTCLITQNSKYVFEYYKNKKQKDKVHKINSCTKSIVSILIGIALDKNYLKSLDEPLYYFFPNTLNEQSDKRKLSLTIRHLITMTDGLDFPEFGEWNCFSPMVYHHDIVKFVIDRPLINEPGTHMNYNSGCTHILSAILQQVTNMRTEEFASKYLFTPLGIKEYRWYLDKKNINKGADGLVLKPEDMQKVGQLILNKGCYNNKRIVSEEWILQSASPYLKTYDYIGYYGMHWWVNRLNEEKDFTEDNLFYFALGFGGQYIIIIPTQELVITVTSDIYEDSLRPMRIIRQFLLNK
ncbi:serine hydrolase domain-containing protein [Fredinandcohnia humi]